MPAGAPYGSPLAARLPVLGALARPLRLALGRPPVHRPAIRRVKRGTFTSRRRASRQEDIRAVRSGCRARSRPSERPRRTRRPSFSGGRGTTISTRKTGSLRCHMGHVPTGRFVVLRGHASGSVRSAQIGQKPRTSTGFAGSGIRSPADRRMWEGYQHMILIECCPLHRKPASHVFIRAFMVLMDRLLPVNARFRKIAGVVLPDVRGRSSL